MKKIGIIIFFLLLCGCNSKTNRKELETKNSKTEVAQVYFDELYPFLHKKDNKIYVINFWATWCKPCVEELPEFIKLHENYKNKGVEVVLISLDFPNQLEKRLVPFIKNNNITPKVIHMIDPDQNTWISKVAQNWSGAIPATLIYNKYKRAFYEQSFTYKELETELNKFKN